MDQEDIYSVLRSISRRKWSLSPQSKRHFILRL